MARIIAAAVSLVTLLLLTATAHAGLVRAQTPTPEADLTATFRQFVDTVNAGDVEGALALFAEDATWLRGGRCPPGACAGQAAIRAELEQDVAEGHRIDIVDVQVSGTTLTARVELRTDVTRAAGIERAIQLFTVEFEGDKISALQARPDFTDPETAALREAVTQQQQLPTAGGGSASTTAAATGLPLPLGLGLLVFGGLLTALGLGMKAAERRR